MYSFQANAGRRKNKHLIHLLFVIIFILAAALIGLSIVYVRNLGVSEATSAALMARALSEANSAQSAVYRLTQSSGTNTMTLLSIVRSHIYALQSLNGVAVNIYGPDVILVDGDLLTACIDTIAQCEARMQAGSVLTATFTTLREQVDAVAQIFAGTI
ncbi:MAG: hypothetical protein IJD60_02770 [Clostridia bacterium]|nr:hypothetical protein [Clostridia bacterium]